MDRKNIDKHNPETEFQLLLTEILRRLFSDFRQQVLLDIRTTLCEKNKPDTKQWLKSTEVKKLLGISHGTLQNLRNNGTIPFTKIGGVIYYSRQEIDKMMKTNRSDTP